MKKMFLAGLGAFVILSSSFMAAEAHHGDQVCSISGCSLGECFMDTDGDGICGDHVFLDENGDGICDYHCYYDGNGDNVCDYFTDGDEDGICDHCHDHGKPVITQRSTGRSRRHHGSHHSSHHGCR